MVCWIHFSTSRESIWREILVEPRGSLGPGRGDDDTPGSPVDTQQKPVGRRPRHRWPSANYASCGSGSRFLSSSIGNHSAFSNSTTERFRSHDDSPALVAPLEDAVSKNGKTALSLARLSARCPDRQERRRTRLSIGARADGSGRSSNQRDHAERGSRCPARAARIARHTFSEVAGISIAGAPMR
jgi:hypothetical protein